MVFIEKMVLSWGSWILFSKQGLDPSAFARPAPGDSWLGRL